MISNKNIKILSPINQPICPGQSQLFLSTDENLIISKPLRKRLTRSKFAKKQLAKININGRNPNILNQNKKGPEFVSVGRPDGGYLVSPIKDPILRVSQLEQNIRFLQEQHQSMLNGLHHEVEILRQRNRDLQFQLVFAKGGIILSSPSSPEDDSKPKILLSPKQINVTPLQIELLEKELGELKLSLQEANTKNSYLSAIVDEQKKKLETFENEWQQIKATSTPQPDQEMRQKLDDADRLIRKLHKENDDQRKEIATLRSSIAANGENYSHQGREYYHNSGQQSRGSGGGGGGGGRRGTHHRGQRDHRFPPLHSQSFWHQGGNSRGGRGSQQRVGGGGGDRSQENDASSPSSGTTLPSLRGRANGQAQQGSSEFSQSFPNNSGGNGNRRSGGYHHNGNHKYRGDSWNSDSERKYRGGRGSKS